MFWFCLSVRDYKQLECALLTEWKRITVRRDEVRYANKFAEHSTADPNRRSALIKCGLHDRERRGVTAYWCDCPARSGDRDPLRQPLRSPVKPIISRVFVGCSFR